MYNRFLYLFGSGFSNFGDGIQGVALAWLILKFTGSPLAIGIAITVTYIPSLLLAPFIGTFTDQGDAQFLVVLTDALRAIVIGSLVYTFYIYESMSIIYILQVCLAICAMVFDPASQTLVRESFREEAVIPILSNSSSINLFAMVMGSGIAGFLISIDRLPLCFFLNAVTFFVSASCNSAIRRQEQQHVIVKSINYQKDISEGWKFLQHNKGMRVLLLMTIISSSSYRIVVTILAPYATLSLGGDSLIYALLQIAFTTGGAIAGFAVSRSLNVLKNNFFVVTFWGISISSLLTGIAHHVPFIAIVALFGLGFFTMLSLSAMHSLITLNSPKEIIGRIVGLRTVIASFAKIISALGAGYLATITYPNLVFVLFGIIVLLTVRFTPQLNQIPIPSFTLKPKF